MIDAIDIDAPLRIKLVTWRETGLAAYDSDDRQTVSAEVPQAFFDLLTDLEARTRLSRSTIIKAMLFEAAARLKK